MFEALSQVFLTGFSEWLGTFSKASTIDRIKVLQASVVGVAAGDSVEFSGSGGRVQLFSRDPAQETRA
jgi:hypothetical protein